VELRNPDKTHFPAAYALLQRCFPGLWTENEVADRIFYDALYDPNHVWMAREQGVLKGLLVSVQDGALGWLKLLAVDPEHRRKGLGKDLLSRAEFRLSGEGVREYRIAPSPPREFLPGVEPLSVAAGFFESQGFGVPSAITTLWTDPMPGVLADSVDPAAMAAFGRAHCGAHWPWVEEQISFRPAHAVFGSGTGLCLADPGLSLGPLWPAPSAKPADLAVLAASALALAASAPCRSSSGLRVWHVEGSAALPGITTRSKTFNTYTKSLS
jgi:GNAT superfamily N-acetyltransferase